MINYLTILETNYLQEEWSISDNNYGTLQWFSDTPKPTQQELDALWASTQETTAKQSCKEQASKLLYETDWTTIADVADPAYTPYLTNQAAFIAWRSQIRALAVNPVVDPVFPPKPTEIWG